jgi:hypothetical protein
MSTLIEPNGAIFKVLKSFLGAHGIGNDFNGLAKMLKKAPTTDFEHLSTFTPPLEPAGKGSRCSNFG